MVTHDLERGSDPLKKRIVVMRDHGSFAVLQRFCTDDIPTIGISDCLMSEADPQQRHFSSKFPDHIYANPGIFRHARSRGKDDAVQIHCLHLI
ncbi:hypothetical protein SDC9_167078 [bioreactor metagenome]|uniref:Uncharacterized protein n=1 Tax=bioreactor metagenome TaxID=1076179 RepID=A0A645G0P2_9ZZZZ